MTTKRKQAKRRQTTEEQKAAAYNMGWVDGQRYRSDVVQKDTNTALELLGIKRLIEDLVEDAIERHEKVYQHYHVGDSR